MTKMGKDGDNKRISQTGDRPKEEIRSRMAEASAIVRSVFGSIQAVAGTTACKGVQIHALYKYAIEHGCWFYNLSELGVFSDRGSENEVYISYSGKWVYKLNDFRYADDNLLSFFERLEAHNLYFPDCAYDLVGLPITRMRKFVRSSFSLLLSRSVRLQKRRYPMSFTRWGLRHVWMASILPMGNMTCLMCFPITS